MKFFRVLKSELFGYAFHGLLEGRDCVIDKEDKAARPGLDAPIGADSAHRAAEESQFDIAALGGQAPEQVSAFDRIGPEHDPFDGRHFTRERRHHGEFQLAAG